MRWLKQHLRHRGFFQKRAELRAGQNLDRTVNSPCRRHREVAKESRAFDV